MIKQYFCTALIGNAFFVANDAAASPMQARYIWANSESGATETMRRHFEKQGVRILTVRAQELQSPSRRAAPSMILFEDPVKQGAMDRDDNRMKWFCEGKDFEGINSGFETEIYRENFCEFHKMMRGKTAIRRKVEICHG